MANRHLGPLGTSFHRYSGSLGCYGYLCRSEALSPLPCLQQYLAVRPVASALEVQDICHLIATTPVPTVLVLSVPSPPISSWAMLLLLQHSPSVIGLHFRPLITCPCVLSPAPCRPSLWPSSYRPLSTASYNSRHF